MLITDIGADDVFVFGSNAAGFHGAGSAGQACRGDARNTWRQDAWFLRAMKAPPGSPDRVGRWAVFGVARGWQRATCGMSYAVQTIVRPGQRRSVSRRDIYHQLVELWAFARERPQWKFLLTPVGQGYSGWTPEEMAQVWDYLLQQHGLPDNCVFTWDRAAVVVDAQT
jgi:hypothetical protein